MVDDICNETTCGTEDDVEKTEHRCPVASAGLAKMWEVLEVVGAKDGVNSEFSAEGAEVAASNCKGLRCEDDIEGFLEGRLEDNFAASLINHLLDWELGLMVEITMLSLGNLICFTNLAVVSRDRSDSTVVAVALLVGDSAWDVNNLSSNAVSLEVLLDVEVTLSPFSSGSVGAEKEHETCGREDEDERDNEGNAPCDMGSQSLSCNQRVEDSRHHEVGDTTTGITPATG